jgi:tRNA 5-methylaminomethyl-2-thiouridine biosynthesis bifunctional protein
MTRLPIVPAPFEFDAHGLPGRWQGRDRFVLLETGFGPGHNFLAVWDAWRHDPLRCARLYFLSFEHQPPSRADLTRAHAQSPLRELADALIDAWPPLTPNLHRLVFDEGRVQLHLRLGGVDAGLRHCVAEVDAFVVDGFAPARSPPAWDLRRMKSIARLAAADATLTTWTAASRAREGLASVGFKVRLEAERSDTRDITRARFEPRFERKRAPLRRAAAPTPERRAVIVGAGLAGCATAWALAEQGWDSLVLDHHAQPAQEASGNPAGLFHGIVNPQDGIHARFNRAAALEAQRAVQQAIAHHAVAGSAAGLLRLNPAGDDLTAMRATLAHLGLPADFVQALDAAQASALCGLPLQHAAWFYPGGGWVDPAGLARAYLERAGPHTRFIGDMNVQALQRSASGWQLCDAQGDVLAEAATVVLANTGDALRLLGAPPWPIEPVRGQLSSVVATHPRAPRPLPRVPLSGAGYLLPEVSGRAVFGSTSQVGDMDPAVRASDHADNLARLVHLRGAAVALHPADLQGRTGWRWVSPDRLPVIGAVPVALAADDDLRLDQPRFVPRQEGLFVFTALGSRGIGWSALGAQVLASLISGAPAPLEADLLDAVDPARFTSRAYRQRAAR